jgi:hypothetical protein
MQPNYQQYGPPPAAPTMAPIPQFSEPTSGGGGSPLKIRELEGRACVIYPVRLNPAVPGKSFNGKPDTDSVVINVLILDGPVPLQYGESRATDGTGGPPVYQLDALPALIEGVMTNNSEVVKSVRAVLESAPGNVIPCRVIRGTQGNRPFLLHALGGALDPQAASAGQVREYMLSILTAIAGGTFVNPTPREINGGPRQPAQTSAAAPAAQYPPQPAAQVQYPPAAPQPVAPVPPPPAGWDPGLWLSLTPEQRAQFLPTH